MKTLKTIRVKIFLLLIFVGTVPVVLGRIFDPKEVHSLFYHSASITLQLTIVLFLSLIISLYLARRFHKLIFITKKINQEDFREKIKIQADDEVGDLGKELNSLFDKLKKNKEQFESTLRERSQKLILSEKKHRELLNIFADVIFETDQKQKIITAKHIQSLLGYKEDEVVGKKWEDFIFSEDKNIFQNAFQESNQTEHKYIKNLKIRMLNKKGEIRYVTFTSRSYFENNQFKRTEGFLRDVTEKELLTEKLLAEKNKLEETYQNLHKSYLALGKVNAHVAALAEINTTFSSDLDWKHKLNYIIESIKAFMQADEALLFVRQSTSKKYLLNYASSEPDFWEEIAFTECSHVIKDILKYRKPLKYFNFKSCPKEYFFTTKGFQSKFVIPVIINNEIVALFSLFFKDTEKIQDIHTKLSLAYTSQMAIALMMSGELDHSLKKIF